MLIQFAAAIAFVSSLQTALAGSTIDELTRQRGTEDARCSSKVSPMSPSDSSADCQCIAVGTQ